MKANEFAKKPTGAKAAPPTATKPKPVVTEAKRLKFKTPVVSQRTSSPEMPQAGAADVLGPGVSLSPGSELHRIRTHNPTLWTKIQNWD
jgi:hypothetical protein